jgi:hypothetical protein
MTVARSFTRARRSYGAKSSPKIRSWLKGEAKAPRMAVLLAGEEGTKAVWERFREEILTEHIAELPGTRPRGWWAFDAPERRRRLGGVGEPRFTAWSDMTWNGLFELWFTGPGWEGTPCDPYDMPTFESQATFLDRHGLLSAAERRRSRPEDFEPEVIRLERPYIPGGPAALWSGV